MKTHLSTILAVGSILAIAMVVYYTVSSPLRISAEDAKKGIADGRFPIILDVRTELEYNVGHYPEAVHIPTTRLNEVEQRLHDKTKGILIYCNTGQRSRAAADLLHAKGYTRVRYITGPYWSLLR